MSTQLTNFIFETEKEAKKYSSDLHNHDGMHLIYTIVYPEKGLWRVESLWEGKDITEEDVYKEIKDEVNKLVETYGRAQTYKGLQLYLACLSEADLDGDIRFEHFPDLKEDQK